MYLLNLWNRHVKQWDENKRNWSVLYTKCCASFGDVLSNTLDFNDDIRENHPAVIHVNSLPPLINNPTTSTFPCVCGVFLTGQFIKGSQEPPKGNPAILHELMEPLSCNAFGNKQCTNKCLDSVSNKIIIILLHINLNNRCLLLLKLQNYSEGGNNFELNFLTFFTEEENLTRILT